MDTIAIQARASKETLYKWFGDLEGLLKRLIERNADSAATPLLSALEEVPPNLSTARSVLEDFAASLLTFLTSEVSVVINRAALSSPALANELTVSGPRRVRAAAAAYFEKLSHGGVISAGDGEHLFSLFFGLVIQDAQINVLLGEPQPALPELGAQAKAGVHAFLTLTRPEPPKDEEMPETLVGVRSSIDGIDRAIIALLAQRHMWVKRAAEIKKEASPEEVESSVRDPDRVKQVLQARTSEARRMGVDPRLISAIWPPMIDTFIELELQHAKHAPES